MRRKVLLFTFIIVIASGCSRQLDLVPEDTLTEKQSLENQASAEAVLSDAYLNFNNASLGQAYFMADQSTKIMDLKELGIPNVWYDGLYGPSNNESVSPINFWKDYYRVVNLVNVVINKLPVIGKFDPKLIRQYIAEAKFIRAFSYLNLLKYFGDGALEGKMNNDGVPLRLESYNGYDGTQSIPRSSNGKVYEQILKDLKEAIPDLPDVFSEEVATRSRATKGSAYALLARTAIYMRDYQLSLQYCNEVLNNLAYSNAASILDVFADNSKNILGAQTRLNIAINELIFAFPISYTPASSHLVDFYNGIFIFAPDFMATYPPKDIRANEMFVAVTLPFGSSIVIPRKFSDPNLSDNLVIIRRADVVLMKAECLANINGVDGDAVELLNTIHQRSFKPSDRPSPFTTADFGNKQELLNAIFKEREWEFAGEGLSRFDRMRTDRKINPVLPKYKYVLPIPYSEIVITGGVLKQNPGY